MKKNRFSLLMCVLVAVQVGVIGYESTQSLVTLPLQQQFFVNLFTDNYVNLLMPCLFMWLISYYLSASHLTHLQQWQIIREGYWNYYRRLIIKGMKVSAIYLVLIDVIGFSLLVAVTIGNRVEQTNEGVFNVMPNALAVIYLLMTQYISLILLMSIVALLTLYASRQWEVVLYPYLVYAIVPLPLTYALAVWPERYVPLTYYSTLVTGITTDTPVHYTVQLIVLILLCGFLLAGYCLSVHLSLKKGVIK